MPWVNQEGCIGCGVCVDVCPVDAISMQNEKALIEMDGCIRCGRCHDVCPQGAVMHDREKIPDEVKDNVEKTKEFMDACARYFGNPEKEKKACLNRMIKHFSKEKIVAEKTIKEIKELME